jgi:hypothetical protein
MFAWLLSQTWAMNTAIRPKTTANPIMTMVLARTTSLAGRDRNLDRSVRAKTTSQAVLNY